MPWAPRKICAAPGCTALTAERYCAKHAAVAREAQAVKDRERGTAAQRGYGHKWRLASKAFLAAHPLCECDECQAGAKRVTEAQVVDHIVRHRGNMALFWRRSNWRAMAKRCHDRKTAREDGAFGRAGQGGVGQNLQPAIQ